MLHESATFKGIFNSVNYLKGGIESGFRHVDTDTYLARLLRVQRQGKHTLAIQVECRREEMNTGDCFILDEGRSIYIWDGPDSTPFERMYANMTAEKLENDRCGRSQ